MQLRHSSANSNTEFACDSVTSGEEQDRTTFTIPVIPSAITLHCACDGVHRCGEIDCTRYLLTQQWANPRVLTEEHGQVEFSYFNVASKGSLQNER